MKKLTLDERKELFEYVQSNLELSDTKDSIVPLFGATVVTFTNLGYKIVRINNEFVQREHNIIYALYHKSWPEEIVDHIDNNSLNNHISNLRASSFTENACNRSMRSDNTIGYKGVFKRELKGGYKGKGARTVYGWMIKLHGATESRSGFATAEEAYISRCAALKLAHGEFANSGQ